jgi:hypothetical protein
MERTKRAERMEKMKKRLEDWDGTVILHSFYGMITTLMGSSPSHLVQSEPEIEKSRAIGEEKADLVSFSNP